MSIRWFVALATPVTLGALLSLSSSCYAPTEVKVTFTTDLGCSAPFHTAIYKGSRESIDPDPQTDTTSCTAGAPNEDARIGTLVFLPSGSKDGSAAVKAVLTLNNKSPAECDSNPADCIVATRTFSFVAHESRKLPIRLLRECLNARCPEGFTCVGLNQCARTECPPGDETCNLAPDPDAGGTSGADGGGPDALDGAVPPEAGPGFLCSGSNNGSVLVPDFDGNVLSAISGTAVYWTSSGFRAGSPNRVLRISTLTGQTDELTTFADSVTGFGLFGEVPMVGHQSGSAQRLAWIGGQDVPVGNDDILLLRATTIPGGSFGLLATANSILVLKDLDTKPSVVSALSLGKPVTGIEPTSHLGSGTVGPAYVVATSDGLEYFDNGTPQGVVGGAASAVLTSNALQRVYAGGKAPGGPLQDFQIQEVNGLAIRTIASIAKPPSDMASDETDVYWIEENNRIRKHTIVGGGGIDTVVPNGLGKIVRVMVDANCIYYWTTVGNDPNTKSVLRAQRKTTIVPSVDGGL